MFTERLDKYYRDSQSDTGYTYIADSGTSRVTWGEPARIVQTIYDKECPCCGCSRQDGFDMGRDSAGSAFGARCPACEWTF